MSWPCGFYFHRLFALTRTIHVLQGGEDAQDV